MNTIRWNVAVSADTDQSLRMFLASQGGGRKGDLSRFIEEAVRAHILELSAEQAKAARPMRSTVPGGRRVSRW
ncbi:methionine repressor-like protein [Pseudomonas aeruginosa]|uniref:ribbon-helix-helix domain-containing protein n=1 Tax=Pseudomonas aeruginosa TaxID=287 RepID=UPI00071B5579|nr:methionine repressor-like protein [Pseudomonas aeruginosa]